MAIRAIIAGQNASIQSPDTGAGEDEDEGLDGALRWRGSGLSRFKVCRMQAYWFAEGKQEDDWTRAMLSVLSLTAWKSVCVEKYRS